MDPRHLEAELIAFAKAAGVDLPRAPFLTALDCMLRFYAQMRADGCEIESDGDMLLFQYGVYDFGERRMFEVDLTRQVILPDEEDDDAIWQLAMTFRYAPSADLEAIGRSDRWCSTPSDLPGFEEFVRASPAVAAVADRRPDDVIVHFGPV